MLDKGFGVYGLALGVGVILGGIGVGIAWMCFERGRRLNQVGPYQLWKIRLIYFGISVLIIISSVAGFFITEKLGYKI